MIEYSEDWIIVNVFRLKGSVAVRASLFAVPAAIISVCLVFMDDWFPAARKDLGLGTLSSSQLWSASSVVVGILLGFRTNRAMARFWEGTGLLHQMRGEWFDSVSCCVTFSRAAVGQKPLEVDNFRHTIVRLMSLCHGSALEEIAGTDAEECETIDSFGLDNQTLTHLKACKEEHHFNRVEVLLHLIQSLITKNLDDGILKIPPPILSRVYQTLSRGFVNLLNAKKIADTRFPFPYVQLITMLLLLHVVLTPIMISSLIKHWFWCPVFTFVPIFGFFSLNFIGVELENPFGSDDNDLPLDHFQAEMNNCLLMLLQDNADLIAGISKTRCIKDYGKIAAKINRGAHEEDGKAKLQRMASKRVSQFAEHVDMDADEVEEYCGRSSLMAAISVIDDEDEEEEIKSGASECQEGADLSLEETLPLEPTVPPILSEMVEKSIEEFNLALEGLRKSAEIQAADLSSSINTVNVFKETLPKLIESIESSIETALERDRERWRSLEKSNDYVNGQANGGPIGRPPGGIARNRDGSPLDDKPYLSGPTPSLQVAAVRIGPLEPLEPLTKEGTVDSSSVL